MKIKKCFLSFSVSIFAIALAHGAPGDLDLSFAGTGFTRTGFGFGEDFAYAVAIQADGKLLVAGSSGTSSYTGGNFSVVRYNTNDTLDISFGTLGKVVTPVGTGQSQANAMRVQPDGKIVLAGFAYKNSTNTDLAVVRYNPDGSLDSSFGINGIVMTDVGISDSATALSLPGDGKILISGSSSGALVLARYLTNGVLDASFDGDGIAIKSTAASIEGLAMTVQSDSKILVAGTTFFQMAVFRFLTNGLPDSSFGTNGTVIVTIGEDSRATAIAVQAGDNSIFNPDKIVIAGSSTTNSSIFSFAVARLNLNGTLDTSFDGDGKVMTRVGNFFEGANAVLIQRSGLNASRIIVAGYSSEPFPTPRRDFTVVKYLLNGALDTAFDGDGKAMTPIGVTGDSQAQAMTFQNGKLLVAGYAQTGPNNNDFAMVRYNLTNGTLDSSYDGDGIKTQDIADRTAQAQDVAIQSDGKIISVGRADNGSHDVVAVSRYNTDGSLDISFGILGKITAEVSTNGSAATAVAIQPDGKIVVAGSANEDFMVLRYLTNGLPDNSFDGDGRVTTPIGSANDSATAVTLQADGKIVLAGYSYNGMNNDFAVARYNTNGSLDISFGSGGKAITAIASGEDEATDVKIQADGKIVVAGWGTLGSIQFALVRYTTNGSLDTSFGSFGRVTTDFGVVSEGLGMTIQTNGRIVVAGAAIVSGTQVDMAVARYLTNGMLDTSFDGDGKVTTPIGLAADFAYAVTLQPDGKILVAGAGAIGADNEVSLVRYLPNGSLDSTYGNGGKVVVDLSTGPNDVAYGIALDEMGRAVIAGNANDRFGVARFLGDPFLKILSIARLPNGHAFLQGIGIPNATHTLQGSLNLNPGSFAPIAPIIPDFTGMWQYDDAITNLNQRFYRLTAP
ncbi:MAG: hypothetical protein M3Y82_09380 [Verrucomicrobiota bacterium]|nr:hypothetical protein [Verrucomicrobiota bacterium]